MLFSWNEIDSLFIFVNASTEKKLLDLSARMKIASSVAEGLQYLHEKAYPPSYITL